MVDIIINAAIMKNQGLKIPTVMQILISCNGPSILSKNIKGSIKSTLLRSPENLLIIRPEGV